MRRRTLLTVLLAVLLPAALLAQATRIPASATLPAACTVGNIYTKTGTSAGFYVCLATNTWTRLAPMPSITATTVDLSTTQSVISAVGTFNITADAAAGAYAEAIHAESVAVGTHDYKNVYGLYAYARSEATGDVQELDGIGAAAIIEPTATGSTAAQGAYLWAENDSADAAVNYMIGTYVAVYDYPAAETPKTVPQIVGMWLHLEGDSNVWTDAYGVFNETPAIYSNASVTNYYADWVGDLAGVATNAYYFWADSQGVFRIREDSAADSGNAQAIPALYNPRFTKYTAGAANYERIVQQWVSNVAQIGAEQGGTGTRRTVEIIGGGLKFNSQVVTPASTGTRYLCISTAGVVTSSASACSGT